MSSFTSPHRFYCFNMKNGRKKLAYGATPEQALEILAYRLPKEEMDQILRDEYERITQRDLSRFLDRLG